MNSISRWAGALCLCASLATPVAARAATAPGENVRYDVYQLGPLGGTAAQASSINDRGWIAGSGARGGDATQHAELWTFGARFDLGTLGGPNSGVFWPVKNDRGVIAGVSETAAMDPLGETWSCNFKTGHVCRGFVWRNGVMHRLPTLGGVNGYAAGANNRGQVIGWAENTVHDPTCVPPQVLQFEAVIWGPDGSKRQLPPYPGDSDTAATAINDRGQAVGISGICDIALGAYSAIHPVLWENGTVVNLGTFGGGMFNTASAINNRGDVVGWSDLKGDKVNQITHAFLWTKAHGLQDLGTLRGDKDSLAYGINDRGVVVGESCDKNGNCRAFIWEHGMMRDLNELAAPGSPPLVYANDVNNFGVIAGGAYVPATGLVPAFAAVPRYVRGAASPGAPARTELPAWLRARLAGRSIFGPLGTTSATGSP